MDVSPKPIRTFKFSATLIALILLCLQFYILFSKDVTALGSDEWHWLPLISDGFDGNFKFQDYWKAHGGHRVFGYKILITLNALFLGLDLRYFQYAGVLLWTLGALVAAYWLNKKLSFGNRFIAVFAAIMIISTLISPHAWLNSDYSLIAWRFGNILGFMLIFICVDKLIYENDHRRNLLHFTLLLFLYTLIFGRGWGQAMLFSTLFFLTIATITFLKMKNFNKATWLSVAIAIGVFVIIIYNSGSQNFVATAEETISMKGLYNYTTGMIGNTLGFDFIGRNNFANRDTIQLLGLFSISIYFIACVLYIKTGLYRKTIFPLLIMCFSVVAILATYYGRGLAVGESAAYAPRWVGETCLGLAGAIAILFHARHESDIFFKSPNIRLIVNTGLYVSCGFILMTHVIAIKSNVSLIGNAHKYDERQLKILFSVPTADLNTRETDAAKKLCSRRFRCEFRPFLDEHNLIPGGDRYRLKPDHSNTVKP